jgi:hypothetical protein
MEESIKLFIEHLNKLAKFGKFYFKFDTRQITNQNDGFYKAYIYYKDKRNDSKVNNIFQEWSGKINDMNEEYFLSKFYRDVLNTLIYCKTSTNLINPITGNGLIYVELRELLQNGYLEE